MLRLSVCQILNAFDPLATPADLELLLRLRDCQLSVGDDLTVIPALTRSRLGLPTARYLLPLLRNTLNRALIAWRDHLPIAALG